MISTAHRATYIPRWPFNTAAWWWIRTGVTPSLLGRSCRCCGVLGMYHHGRYSRGVCWRFMR